MVGALKVLQNSRGAITLKALIWILVIFSAVYAAYKFVPPEVGHYLLRTEVEDEAKTAYMYKDETLTKHILDKAEMWSVPITADDIAIRRQGSTISISIDYAVTVHLLGGYTKVRQYSINVVRPLEDSNRTLY